MEKPPYVVSLSPTFMKYRDRHLREAQEQGNPLIPTIAEAFFASCTADTPLPVRQRHWRDDELYVARPDGETCWIKRTNTIRVSGDIRKVPRIGRMVGKSSLMGRIAHGISSGKAFRGRG